MNFSDVDDDEDCAAAAVDDWTVCGKCDRRRPPMAHHCRRCGQCVRKMDHHCPWSAAQLCYKIYFYILILIFKRLTLL